MNRNEYTQVMFNSDIPYPERLLYAYLRSCVDYKTGIAGEGRHKRISYQAIREALEFLPAAGSRSSSEIFDKHKIFKLLKSLERRGLIRSLPNEKAAPGRRGTIRKLLPLAVGAGVRPQEEGDEEDDYEGDYEGDYPDQTGRGLQPFESDEEGDYEGDEESNTSVYTLSLSNKYIYYASDIDDDRWALDQFGAGALTHYGVDEHLETEKFNLKYREIPDYDLGRQRSDWRTWMIRAFEYARRRA